MATWMHDFVAGPPRQQGSLAWMPKQAHLQAAASSREALRALDALGDSGDQRLSPRRAHP